MLTVQSSEYYYFSVGDLAIMNHYESIANMKLVLSNGKMYSMAIGDGKRLNDEDFAQPVKFMTGRGSEKA